ncbi:MAG TPA: ribonuclease D [Tepidisphaeraceae bacterium]|jgi:ribonuclease D
MSESADPAGNIKRVRYARSAHRARSHDSAHAQTPAPSREELSKHADVPAGEAEMVASDHSLRELIAHLRDSKTFAYDSEFIGELTYLPKLCLIQVATTSRIALIDPLAGLDLMPFWELLGDDSVEKVVHAGDQDVEPVGRHLGRPAANVFDTQLAAGFIGMAYPVALLKLVHEIIGIKLGKGLTFSHWDQRPLSAMQLRYAADDVRYLPALRTKIGQKLDAMGHMHWAREEFDNLCDVKLYQFDPETHYLRVRGATSLSGQQLAVLKELTVWRDAVARAHDVPPRAFLKDELLVDLSRNPVKDVQKLGRVRGLPRPVEAAHGAEIVAATLRGLSTSPAHLPPVRPEPTPTERFRADALWAAAQCLCIGQSLDPALVTSRQEIGDFYRYLCRGGKEPNIGLLKGWRRSAVGDPLREMVSEGKAITLDWSDGSLRAQR